MGAYPGHYGNDIELRVCRNQDCDDEDILIEAIEIYVQ